MHSDLPIVSKLPAPLVDEFVNGRWLPIVGAGLSVAAEGCPPPGMPDWATLGEQLGSELPPAYSKRDAVEAISAWEHEFGRTQLTSRIAHALHVGKARPSHTQLSFARLSFEHVVTTNVEQLLEDAYRKVRGAVLPVVEDGQLRLANPYDTPTLVKLHGDVHHPSTLILTEEDYDNALITRPIMFTWLAGQLISRTGVLIGYSLNDPDVRMLLANLRNGLQATPPDLWVLTLDDDPVTLARYARRGVRVARLPRTPAKWGVLGDLFEELLELAARNVARNVAGTTSAVDSALRSGQTVDTLVAFLVAPGRVPLFTEFVFPHLMSSGLIPASRADVRARPGFTVAATDSLLRAAGAVVVEADSEDDPDVRRAVDAVGQSRTIVLRSAELPHWEGTVQRPSSDVDGQSWSRLGEQIARRLTTQRRPTSPPRAPQRVDKDARGRALVALVDLEAALYGLGPELPSHPHPSAERNQPLRELLFEAIEVGVISGTTLEEADSIIRTRNALVHGRTEIPESTLVSIRLQAEELVRQIRAYQESSRAISPESRAMMMLDRFIDKAPGGPHARVFDDLRNMGFSPYVSSSLRPYIRWVSASRSGKRLSVYQDWAGLSVDSKVHGPRAAHQPGAVQDGRRVVFRYSEMEPHAMIRAISALKDA